MKLDNPIKDKRMKILKKFLPIFIVLFSQAIIAQTFIMDGTPITSCSGSLFDSGGPNGDYSPNENIITTICPDLTTGTHIQLAFNPPNIGSGDDICFYDGASTGANLLTCASFFTTGGAFLVQATAANTENGCLTLEFTSDGSSEGSGWEAVIECVPACQQIIAVLDATTPAVSPVDTGYIDICKGNTVSFSGSGLYPQNGIVYQHSDLTSDFEWNFGDGSTKLGPEVEHTFEEAGGYVVQLKITDQFGCKNINFLNQRVRVSSEPEIVLGDYESQICMNDTLELNAIVNNTNSDATISINPVDLGFQTGATLSDSLALPDGNGTSYSTSVSFNNFGPGQLLTDVNDLINISMNIEHSWLGDLEITLTAPNGAEVILHEFNTVNNEVFLGEPDPSDFDDQFGLGYDYTWSSQGVDTWAEFVNNNNVTTLPAGDYSPFESFDALLGTPLNGQWTITVTDNLELDNGFIFNWGINFASDLFPLVETFSPQLVNYTWLDQSIINYLDQDSISAIPTSAGVGNFIFEVEDEFGCFWESNVNVEFLPEAHPDCFECDEILNEIPDTLICVGDVIELDAGGTNLEFDVPFQSFTDYEIGFSNHPPLDPYNAEINVSAIQSLAITDPISQINSVCIDFQTNFLSDIAFYLMSPAGVIVELTSNNGGTSDFYTETCFTPGATTNITAGTSPYTGEYQIEGNWNDLIGSPINGTWTLLVSDAAGATSFGNLNWWSISFASGISTDILWSPATNIDCANCPVVQYTAIDDTDQELIVEATNSLGCIDTDTIQINITPPVEAPTVNCNNDLAGTIIFEWPAVGAFTDYEINVNGMGFEAANQPGGLSHSVTGLNNGDLVTAIIRVADTGDECNILETTIDCYNCIMVTGVQSIVETSCFNTCDGQAVLEVSGGDLPYTFSYLDADGVEVITNSPNINDLCPGPNVLSIIDGASCVESYNVDIPAPDEILVTDSIVSDASCFGLNNGSIQLTTQGGVGALTEQCFDQANNPVNPNSLTAGQYTIILTDENNCSDTTSYSVEEPGELQVSEVSTDNVLCFGNSDGQATMEVLGGTYPYVYSWSTNTNTDSVNVDLPAGINTFTVVDDQGCTASFDVNIGTPDVLELSIIQTEEACFGEDNNIAVPTVIGGVWPYTFDWSNNTTDSIATTLPAGLNTLTVIDENGCIVLEDISITELEQITYSSIESNPDCFGGDNGSVEIINVQGGSASGNYSYIFNNNPPVVDPLFSDLSANTLITVQVTDELGCLSEANIIELENPQELQINFSVQDVSCGGLSDGVVTVNSVSFGQAPFTYSWTVPGSDAIVSDLASGQYGVTIVDNLGCEVSDLVDLPEPTPVEADFDLTQPPCNGKNTGAIDLTTIGGAGGYSYIWSNNEISQDLENLFSGTYQVTVTDANDCVFEFEIDLPEPTPINPGLEVFDLNCYGVNDGSLVFNTSGATPPYLFMINESDYFGNPNIVGQEPGDYNIEIIDDNGCTFDTLVTITEPDELMIDFPSGSSLELNLEDDIFLNENYIEIINPQGAYTVEWIPAYEGTLSCTDCENPVATPFNTISYEVLVQDENGCRDIETLIINVNKYRVVLVPRGFSPNGDANNDFLLTHGKDGTIVNTFQVFDRWGTLVYERSNFEINDTDGWDGTFRGKDMPEGTYLWYVHVTYIDGLSEGHEGQVNLIR
jgi:gliding motility-associated-like protein